MTRGYFAIGIIGGKTPANVGTLWRSAQSFGAAYIFTIGARYTRQPADTSDATRHVPLMTYDNVDDFSATLPADAAVIGIECGDYVHRTLGTFQHPERAIYLLGAEDTGIPRGAQRICDALVAIPGTLCLNVAVAGSIALYDRINPRKR